MALSPAQMQEAIIRNLPAKTGRSLEEWIALARTFNLSERKAIVSKLKDEYGLGHVQAQTIAGRMVGKRAYVDTTGYEEGIFKTPEQMELYLFVKEQVLGMSDEIKVRPCNTYIPFYGRQQFAAFAVKGGRVVLGLKLPEGKYEELADAGRSIGSDNINKLVIIDRKEADLFSSHLRAAYKYDAHG